MNIIIIGAGPAGMVAAINAKNENNNVILIEKNDR
ncbi:MAG: NAD(P)/FAD-dependent oxidoreductase, partial [Peptoniphilus harei]|nr:NAD(P)/FAD-dependent oxidoreductase [Peptoniphilus harei]